MQTFSKVAAAIAASALISLVMPFFASAQAVNATVTTQQSFLAELQSLQQELVALASTISTMITAAGGVAPSTTTTLSTPAANSGAGLQMILPPNLSAFSGGSLGTDGSGGDISSQLLQAIMPSVSTTTFIATPSTAAATATATIISNAPQSTATQLDPSCVSSLFANNAQCGGLYYCSTSGGYWSAASCINGQ
jgi:hypothetical protein